MAKLKVNEVEATSTNADVSVTTKGSTGTLEVKGNSASEATLQLNCSAQSHGVKIKAPSNGADLGYTMTLPDNQIAANKGLKVKSVTNNVAQLEYADFPSTDISSIPLDAANLTSGTIPAARMPSFPASSGLGFKLISKQEVTSSNVNNVQFTGLENNSAYHLVFKHVGQDGIQGGTSGNNNFYLYPLDSSNNRITASAMKGTLWEYWDPTSGDRRASNFSGSVGVPIARASMSYNSPFLNYYGPFSGHMDFTTGNMNAVTVNGTSRYGQWGWGQTFTKGWDGSCEYWWGMGYGYYNTRVYGIELGYYQTGVYIEPNKGCQFLLYKYVES